MIASDTPSPEQTSGTDERGPLDQTNDEKAGPNS